MKVFLMTLLFLITVSVSTILYAADDKLKRFEQIPDITIEQRCKDFAYVDYKTAQQFAKKIKILIIHDDRQTLSELSTYPLKIYGRRVIGYEIDPYSKIKFSKIKKYSLVIKTKEQFVIKYNDIFTTSVKKEIIATLV